MPEVEWSEVARRDLLAIIDYISDDNPDAAQRLKDDIEAKVAMLPPVGKKAAWVWALCASCSGGLFLANYLAQTCAPNL